MAVDGADSGSTKKREDEVVVSGTAQDEKATDPLVQLKTDAMKARIDAVWKQMNSNGSTKMPNIVSKKSKVAGDKPKRQKAVPDWMVSLGMAPEKPSLINLNSSIAQASSDGVELKIQQKAQSKENNESSEEARKFAAAALAAVKEAAAASKEGKIEVSEVRDFAGEEVKLRKFVDPDSKEAQMAQEKARMQASSSSGLDKLLEQISKKRKLNILDKSKKDWGEFKEEKGLEDELDAYKKSGDKYLDKVSFLQRAELREYEKERELRLAQMAKRRADSQRE
uniref:TSA: Wollemia nobilis Ref_Wollemi_Transcript_21911_1392 transcribed RNA sequence n=1 Tax=Wollemia nobilis TaxID=56998 RepID=A0A0C9QMN7_9CONI